MYPIFRHARYLCLFAIICFQLDDFLFVSLNMTVIHIVLFEWKTSASHAQVEEVGSLRQT